MTFDLLLHDKAKRWGHPVIHQQSELVDIRHETKANLLDQKNNKEVSTSGHIEILQENVYCEDFFKNNIENVQSCWYSETWNHKHVQNQVEKRPI